MLGVHSRVNLNWTFKDSFITNKQRKVVKYKSMQNGMRNMNAK